jgi:predicted nucleotidyltransferase
LQLIVEMRFGSHLYGTATPSSDTDLKAVYLPDADDILLQRVAPTLTESRAKEGGERNRPEDVDRETYSLQRYLQLLADGQSVAIDMLFAPDVAMTREPDPLWRRIQALGPRLVSSRASAFVRYCRQQANKYGIKGSRVAAARKTLTLLSEQEALHGAAAKLDTAAAALERLAETTPHVALVDIEVQPGRTIRHLEVCERKASFQATLKNARELAERLVEGYGQRALDAEKQEGVDWKALSHAVRIGRQAIELYETGRIVFPLASAEHLRQIKLGKLPYAAVAAEIEQLVEAVEAAAARAAIPASPDTAAMEALVREAYRRQILESEV